MHIKEKIKGLNESENIWIGFLRDVLSVASVVAILASVSYFALGLWSPLIAVESGSMLPHIQIGDLIFVESIDRTEITTYEESKNIGYASFSDYGDVILYKPGGKDGVTPIIHRAMYYVEEGEPMWENGPAAPYAGYITKGDNNQGYDQMGSISYLKPIKKE